MPAAPASFAGLAADGRTSTTCDPAAAGPANLVPCHSKIRGSAITFSVPYGPYRSAIDRHKWPESASWTGRSRPTGLCVGDWEGNHKILL